MAAASGRDDTALSDRLHAEAYRFDFFQAVRLLECAAREASRAESGRPQSPVGQDGAPRQEAVRFRALASHSFPTGAISEIRPATKPRPAVAPMATEQNAPTSAVPPLSAPSGPPEMVTAFLGLTGPSGVLPRHYTTLLIERTRAKDYALRDFLDVFNHRAISLFYRAWQKYRLPFAYEQFRSSSDEAAEDLVTQCL
jgi:type VI secretion system protein ImpH